MVIYIAQVPEPQWWAPEPKIQITPGEALNAFPFEGQMRLDFTTPIGAWSGLTYSLFFQFLRWGFVRFKIEEWVSVSPVFREYYDLTIRQKDQLEGIIKNGLTSIANSVSDMELIWHDLRRYKEFLDYFLEIERGKRLIKEGNKEEGEKLKAKGNQTLKAVFIDEVDVHTGDLIAMKSIAPRWPTIIADFMRLEDDQTDPKKIAKDLEISEAEGVVLATKNKLFLEWRDKLFYDTVKRRYDYLMQLLEARKRSVKEYREMLRPTLARFRMINDALSKPTTREEIYTGWIRPDAQAVGQDFMRIWAWRPFHPPEKYKYTYNWITEIPLKDAGFTKKEIEELKQEFKKEGKELPHKVKSLPIEPSIDRIVRVHVPEIEKDFGVKLTIKDVYNARETLVKQFEETVAGHGGREPWVFSPYFVFIEIPMLRTVWRLPNGTEFEDVEMSGFECSTRSENIIIINILELIAKQKAMDNYVNSMLGEVRMIDEKGIEKTVPISEILKEEFPEIYIEGEKELKEKLKSLEKIKETKEMAEQRVTDVKETVNKFLKNMGFDLMFVRARGPYEFAMKHRISKTHQIETGSTFGMIRDFMKGKMGVPGLPPIVI